MSLSRVVIATTTAALCYLKQRRRVAVAPEPRDGLVKINPGCGLAVHGGSINVKAAKPRSAA